MEKFFQLMTKEILPALRALMAKKLLDNGFSQGEVAEKMGLTQPAISQYKRALRGTKKGLIEKNPKIAEMANSLAKRIATNQVSPRNVNLEMLDICRVLME